MTRRRVAKVKTVLGNCLEIMTLLAWTGIVIIAAQLSVGMVMLLIMSEKTLSQPVPMAFYSMLSYALALWILVWVTPRIVYLWKTGQARVSGEAKAPKKPAEINRKAIGLSGWPTWTDVGLAPAGLVVYSILAAIMVAIFSNFTWFDASETQNVGFSPMMNSGEKLIAFMILVVVAPIMEELIFRGWLYGKIREKTSRQTANVVSIIISTLLVSLLFGIVHLQWNVGVNVFAMSIVLCALREVTGTVYAGILVHMLKNGIAFYLLYALGMG